MTTCKQDECWLVGMLHTFAPLTASGKTLRTEEVSIRQESAMSLRRRQLSVMHHLGAEHRA